jgi:uncharacterized protein YjiS (DUF1127 family)
VSLFSVTVGSTPGPGADTGLLFASIYVPEPSVLAQQHMAPMRKHAGPGGCIDLHAPQMLQCSNLLPRGERAAQQKEFRAMATLTSSASHSSQAPFLDLLQPTLNAFTVWRAEQRKRAQIARELATYTDRELFDLRVQRADFPAIINGTYTR